MSGRWANAKRGQAGYVSVYVALVASLVLVPMVMLLIDLTMLAYWRTKLRNTADALAIGAVAESSAWHIPVPTEFVGYFPVNGYLVNTLHLSNLETGFKPEVGPKLKRLVELNQDRFGPQAEVHVGQATVLPLGNLVSPYLYVKIPVEAEVRLLTPFLGNLIPQAEGKEGHLTLRAESCAVAWYRPDRWVHRWWNENPESLTKTLDLFVNVTDEPNRYYRLTNCVEEATDLISLAELVIAEHLKLNPEVKQFLQNWWSKNPDDKEVKRAREGMERLPERCQRGDPCVEPDQGAIDQWGQAQSARRRAEEAAERAREEAARRAADGAGRAAEGDDGGGSGR